MQVGGDLLDILPIKDQRVVVFLGDAMGHGVQAAMIMAATKTALHNACDGTDKPGGILRRINLQLCGFVQRSFVGGLCAVLDPPHRSLRWASAGQPFLWNFQHANGCVTQADPGGLPMGIRSSEEYETFESTLQEGDAIVLCTDGVVEARNARGKFYGQQRTVELLRSHGASRAHELLDGIYSHLKQHQGRRRADDDLTPVVIKAQG
jgi:serine phosphatase RsbU (regulator of sigma subunit)